MTRSCDAAFGRLKRSVQRQVPALLLLLLLPGSTSGCRDTFSSKQPYQGTMPIHQQVQDPQIANVPWAKPDLPASAVLSPALPMPTLPPPSVDVGAGAGSGASIDSRHETTARCETVSEPSAQIAILPRHPSSHAPIRVVGTFGRTDAGELTLSVVNGNGETETPERSEIWGYRPRAVSGYFVHLAEGDYSVRLAAKTGELLACSTLHVTGASPAPETVLAHLRVWEAHRDWTPAMEDLYSVFVAKLFYVRPGGRKGWRPLHQAIRDPYRNILYGVLGLDEDRADAESPVKLEPDCADAPYQLRAYFSWKLGLPFLFNRCNRGSSVTGPSCSHTYSNHTAQFRRFAHPVERFNAFVEAYVGWKVHSGNGRTLPESEDGDVYPTAVTADAIRPGIIFVDAGGHVILVSQVEPQTESRMGTLYGVDAHPDRTVTHKQFGSGTFVFNHRVPTDGFKAFRPVVRDGEKLRFLTNREIVEQGFPAWSPVQSRYTSGEAFYTSVSAVFNPTPPDPETVLKNKLDLLYNAMLERAEAVALGVAYMEENNWREMSMPSGPAIFQTTGPWETYSTPARDMRCFLALDDVLSFPKKAVKNRAQYRVSADVTDEALRRRLEAVRDAGLKARAFSYTRSDGSVWELDLSAVVERQAALEMGYNPNDCIEIRWGAAEGTEEMSTCDRKAGAVQRMKMRSARPWFAARRRPDQR